MSGSLDVLSCCHGHMSFSFEKNDPIETENAKRVIQDMLKRGYALFVEGKGGKLMRVKSFNAKREVYIVGAGATAEEIPDGTQVVDQPKATKASKKRQSKKEIPIRSVKATGIGPTAGG